MDPEILDSARRHGIADDEILHAFRNPIRTFDVDDGLIMLIGTTTSGQLIEVGVVDGPVIVHAMPARDKFLR